MQAIHVPTSNQMSKIQISDQLQTRASFATSTYNDESGSVEVVWTTGARGARSTWDGTRYFEELEVSERAVDMSRLTNGAPVLNSHGQGDLKDVIGVVERAWIANGEGRAQIRFSEREDVKAIRADVKAGILRHISVGYAVQQYEKVAEVDGAPVMRATKWTPAEISLVPVAFDDRAQIRSKTPVFVDVFTRGAAAEEQQMSEVKTPPAPVDDQVANAKREMELKTAVDAATAAETVRITEINRAVRAAKLGDEFAAKLIADRTSLADARAQVLEKMAAASDAQPVIHAQVSVGTTEGDKSMRGALSALVQRYGLVEMARSMKTKGHVRFQDVDFDGGGEFASMRLSRIAQEFLERSGVSTRGMSDDKIVGRAMTFTRGGENTTSDYSVLLENVLYKTLLGNYALADDTWRKFCKVESVQDFRASNRYRTGSFGTLDVVAEGQEFKNKNIPDGLKQTISVQTKGNMIGLSRQAVVNDDMGAVMDTAAKFGRAAGLSIESDVYALLNANSGLGFMDGTGTDFFSSANANLNGSGTALGVQGIDADRVVLASQKDISANEYLGLAKYGSLKLLVPISLGGLARNVNKSTIDITQSNKFNVPNIVEGLFAEVIDSPRLTGTRRYIFAPTDAAAAIVVAFLNGQEAPFMEQKLGWRVDGTEWKLRLDYRALMFDPKGAVTNAGA